MSRRMLHQGLIALVLMTPALAASKAEYKAEQRGKAFARTHCARCHAIDRVSASPVHVAPPLRTLHQRYPIENLEEAFAEGIYTGHPEMRSFALAPGQIHDLLSYLKTLE